MEADLARSIAISHAERSAPGAAHSPDLLPHAAPSLIAGTAKDTALPVDVIDQKSMERRGSPTVMDMIRTLPATGSIIGEANTINAAGQGLNGSSTVNLRGLGANRTLVLLNGRRLVGYASGTVDTNLMPLAGWSTSSPARSSTASS
jgi:outer membrane cobalamin receptor